MRLQNSGFIPRPSVWRAWVGVFLWLATMLAWAEVPVPPLSSRVTDLTATLDAAGKQSLEARLATLEQARGVQLAVLLVASTQPESIEQYALRVAESWKLGRKGVDDGVLLLLAKEDRTLRIEVGYGLEGVIPDALAKRIIAEVMVPKLKEGDFAGGVNAGVDALIKLVEGEPLPLPEPKSRSAVLGVLEALIPMVMMFVAVVGGIMRLLFGRLAGAVIAASVAFVGAWIMFGGLLIAVIVAVVTLVFTLMGVGLGRLGGGGGRSGGGGGGFSGGGGGFGGGGASGRW